MAEGKVEERCQHLYERDVLGKAIAQAAIKAGIIDGSISLTGPQLLFLCDELAVLAACGKRLPQAGHKCVVIGSHNEHHCEYGCCTIAAPNTRQRAERAASKWLTQTSVSLTKEEFQDEVRQLADIIAAEFEK